jgi:hypothetical protein
MKLVKRKHANPSSVPIAEHNLNDCGVSDRKVPWNVAAHTRNRRNIADCAPLSRCDQKPPQ